MGHRQMSVYNLRKTKQGFHIVKWDEDFNIASRYDMTMENDKIKCTCPQSKRGPCKHLEIAYWAIVQGRVDTAWFYDDELEVWAKKTLNDQAPDGYSETVVEAKPKIWRRI